MRRRNREKGVYDGWGRQSRQPWRILAMVVILVALGHNMARTWQRWGDLVIDSGRELDTPKQLLAGRMLYADVRYWYGPLAPYVNAALYRLFGVHAGTLTTAGIVSAAMLAWLAYRLVRLFAPRAAATLAVVVFLYGHAFGQFVSCNIFCFPLPYTYSATYGMLLAVAGVYFLVRYARHGRPRDFLLSGLLLGLTALCKVEILFAAGVAHVVFLGGWFAAGRLRRPVYVAGYAIAAGIPACIYAGFYARVGVALWRDNLFLPGNLTTSRFNLEQAGLLTLVESLRSVALSVGGAMACMAVAWVAAQLERGAHRNTKAEPGIERLRILAPAVGGALLCGAVGCVMGPTVAFRSLPVLLLAGFVAVGGRWLKARAANPLRPGGGGQGEEDPDVGRGLANPAPEGRGRARSAPMHSRAHPCARPAVEPSVRPSAQVLASSPAESSDRVGCVPLLVLYAFGLAAMVRCLLRCGADHYGFVLAVPGLLGVVVFWCRQVPGWLGAESDDVPMGQLPRCRPSPAACVCGVGLLAGLALTHGMATRKTMQDSLAAGEAAVVRTAHGALPCQFVYQDTVDAAVRFLAGKPPATTVVAFPEGSAVTFLAGCVNPLGLHTFLPLDFTGGWSEAVLLERLSEGPPDYVLLLSRSLEEYGSRGFGVDYGQSILAWIAARYREVERFRSFTYHVTVYERRPTSAPK